VSAFAILSFFLVFFYPRPGRSPVLWVCLALASCSGVLCLVTTGFALARHRLDNSVDRLGACLASFFALVLNIVMVVLATDPGESATLLVVLLLASTFFGALSGAICLFSALFAHVLKGRA